MASIAAAAAAAAASEPLLDDVPTTRSNNPEEAEEAEGIRDTQKEEDSKEKDVENDEDVIDEEQLNEFRDQLVALGTFPDKVTINTLSMIAEDYKESRSSSQKLYAVWRERLLRNTNTNHNTGSAINTTGAEQLVAIYVLDSILKNTSSNTNTNGRHHRPSYFVELVQADAATWMPTVYANVRHSAHQREKLHKVWRLWQDTSSAGTTGSLFEDAAWKSMGECFGSAPPPSLTAAAAATTTAAAAASSVATSTTLATSPPPVAGIARTKDGTLILSKGLRQEMQNILDDMQSDIANELDKVSLERLADINPDLLINIKNAAADAVGLMNNSQQQLQSFTQNKSSNARLLPPSSKKQHSSSSSSLPPFLLEIRSETTMSRSNEWNDYMTAHHPDGRLVTERILVNLKKLVMTGTNEAIVDNDDNDDNPAKLSAEGNDSVVVYTKTEALDMTQYYATGLTVAQILSDAMERNISTQIEIERRDTHSTIFADKNQSLGLHRSTDNENKSYNTNKTSATSAAIGSRRRRMGADNRLAAVVDLANFTNEGIKEANPGAISLLYELGLPFQSTADGLRFATQLELSQHLDGLFKRNQLRKTIAVTEERGWYVSDRIWTREQSALDEDALLQASAAGSSGDDERLAFRNSSSTPITSSSMVPADETRDRCVVCGIPFQMVFDNDDGVYKYKNCLEILLLHDNEDNDVAIQVDSQQQLVHVTCWNGLGQPTVLTYDQTLPDVCSFQHETD